MKKTVFLMFLFLAAVLVLPTSCSKDNNDQREIKEFPKPPVSPEQPSDITRVVDIKSGAKTGEVLLFGKLTRQKDNDADEYYFSDDGGTTEIVLDFPDKQLPPLNQNILVYGGVEDNNEVDVIAWRQVDSQPTPPVNPPVNPPTNPDLKIDNVRDILSGSISGEVLVAGSTTSRVEDDDCDEWFFNDGTGTIKLDFPTCNVPNPGVPIYAYGSTTLDDGQVEIDVRAWQAQ